ncbi:alpha-L-arabinofuranosidase [Mucilaginibacter achroorhodeus]|uniref:non-reducing end alpha-L-arabinofuranosidase n=1 Tax=Mucilaginibacter achroorhodeus TaxID=2599294 RepID=A0A563TXQ2_9SPHI|nr:MULTISPECIES: alpha-L-arabinofuranosidase C-terminal domain-containing protein [Mucilaginibacter]QXV65936.1 alpha-L-arabinofuranosidase [Mucilaginibacter sp. 21P]TWR24148.1 alpha-L-arabinofuranosidase [Mucilaginibacter achroorhodeus]
MNKKFLHIILTAAVSLLGINALQAQTKLTIQVDKPGIEISPTMWGIFFEDINFAADGGLYAEMVKNRSFEFADPLMGWDLKEVNGGKGNILVVNRNLLNTGNQRYADINLENNKGTFEFINEGFRGMGFKSGEDYNLSMMAKVGTGNINLQIQAVNEAGAVIAQTAVEPFTKDWKTLTAKLKCTQNAAKGSLKLIFTGTGRVQVDMISLFPENTFKHRKNGLRADLAQKLADLHPGFMRFPGGCIVEGRDLANRYQWKKTVGNVSDRQLIINRWNTEFSYRSAPDYFQSFGLGFFDYFQLCEDIGAAPLPILNCGMACQFNSGEVISINQLDPFIQDALDLIEFANGGLNTKWGRLRADMGHPAPFNLKTIGIGNEQWGEQYLERYKLFAAAIHNKHPEVAMVTSAGPFSGGELFDYLNKALRAENAGLIDEHYYAPPEWFLRNANRYDKYSRDKTKIFAGEYAAHIKDDAQKDKHAESHNTWWAALCEAAFMTGLERNADVVNMASYAPLLAHVDAWQWRPDLIWFDNLRSVATPNYYVQQAFSANKGSEVVPVTDNGKALTGQDSLYSSSTIDRENGKLIIKVVNTSLTAKQVSFDLQGATVSGKDMQWMQLSDKDKLAFNSVDNPDAIKPVIRSVKWVANKPVNIEPLSVNVITLTLRKTK